MKYLSQIPLRNKRVLLRVDYNVSLTPSHTIADDERIRESLPTIQKLLSQNNRIIIVSHLGRPKAKDASLSLLPVKEALQKYLSDYTVSLVDNFEQTPEIFTRQTPTDILLLENIRFYPEEETNDRQFAQTLAALADVYVNDAFSVDHRQSASIVGVTEFLPSLAGLSLEEELTYLSKALSNPTHPFVAITGGAKISTKLTLLEKLLEKVDSLLVGGGIATTLLKAKGYEVGKSMYEPDLVEKSHKLLEMFSEKLILPIDVAVQEENQTSVEKPVENISPADKVYDIGQKTREQFADLIRTAQTILWNGPVGYFEQKPFEKGTNAVYDAIVGNKSAVSIVGGGDTIAALSAHPDFHSRITHISTGGGAMLSYLQDGTLPGVEALERNTITLES